ncbi:MAG: hypothetical protein K8T91_26110 [Planctomycetes bacterium]|nr:hypothetical protein [Planctomycetota bacterium]
MPRHQGHSAALCAHRLDHPKAVGLAFRDVLASGTGYNNSMAQPEPPLPAATPRRFRWRRLVQYRLRTLLILTTVIAVVHGWWSYKARQQREAVAALRKAGAFIQYGDEPHVFGFAPDQGNRDRSSF